MTWSRRSPAKLISPQRKIALRKTMAYAAELCLPFVLTRQNPSARVEKQEVDVHTARFFQGEKREQ